MIHLNDKEHYTFLPRMYLLMPFSGLEQVQLELYLHDGEEFIYVLEGILTVFAEGGEYTLNPGDSIQIHSPHPHNWINQTNRITKILAINTPNPLAEKESAPL